MHARLARYVYHFDYRKMEKKKKKEKKRKMHMVHVPFLLLEKMEKKKEKGKTKKEKHHLQYIYSNIFLDFFIFITFRTHKISN